MDLKQEGICSTSSGKGGRRTKRQEHRKAEKRRDSQKSLNISQFSKAKEEIFINLLQMLSYQGLSQWSIVTEDLLVPHANADVQVKCLTPETLNHHLQRSSFPDWAYAQNVLNNSWDSEFVRPLHSSSTIDPPPEATLALGYSR